MKSDVGVDEIEEIERRDTSAEDIHLLDLLIVLSRRRKLILLFTVCVTILIVISVVLIPSRYTAETVVLPPSQSSSVSSALVGQLGGSGALASAAGASLGIKNPGDMYVSLFQSRTVEDAIIQRFGLLDRYHVKKQSAGRAALEGHATVSLGAKDGLIRIAVWDSDPKTAAEIANGWVEEFRKLSANLAISEASQRRAFFQQQLLEANENLATAEEAMKHTQQTTGVLEVDSQAKSVIESVAALRAQVVAKEVQLQAMRTYATENNPEMVVAQQQLAALQAQLAKVAGSDENSDMTIRKGNIPEAGMEYVRRLRDVKYYETITDLIAKQFEAAKIDEARQGTVIQVVDAAVPPDTRSFPKRGITVIVGTLLGFFLACGLCLLLDTLRRVKNDPNEQHRIDALRATFR